MRALFLGCHYHPPFYLNVWLLCGNTWGVKLYQCPFLRSETCITWWCIVDYLINHYFMWLNHGQPQSQLMQTINDSSPLILSFCIRIVFKFSLAVTGPCILQISCLTWSNISSDHLSCNSCCSHFKDLITPCVPYFWGAIIILPFI